VADDGGDISKVDEERDEGRESVSEAESESEFESGKVMVWTQSANEGIWGTPCVRVGETAAVVGVGGTTEMSIFER
jgi:hypothetical protein